MSYTTTSLSQDKLHTHPLAVIFWYTVNYITCITLHMKQILFTLFLSFMIVQPAQAAQVDNYDTIMEAIRSRVASLIADMQLMEQTTGPSVAGASTGASVSAPYLTFISDGQVVEKYFSFTSASAQRDCDNFIADQQQSQKLECVHAGELIYSNY